MTGFVIGKAHVEHVFPLLGNGVCFRVREISCSTLQVVPRMQDRIFTDFWPGSQISCTRMLAS